MFPMFTSIVRQSMVSDSSRAHSPIIEQPWWNEKEEKQTNKKRKKMA